MKIDFPKKYSVRLYKGPVSICGAVDVPKEYITSAFQILSDQDWIPWSCVAANSIDVRISTAYEITIDEAHSAICKLIEHVMEPTVELDSEVWGDV